MKTTPPIRLRDDPDAAPDLRADLARAASSSVGGYDVAQGLARFEAAIQTGTVPTGTSAAPAGAGAKALLAPALGGALAGILAITVAAGLSPTAPSAPARSTAPAALSSPTAPAPVAPLPPPSPDLTPPVIASSPARVTMGNPEGVPQTPPARVDPPRTTESLPTPPPAAEPPAAAAPASRPDSLAAETDNLVRARALSRVDPAGALALATEGHRLFPGGVFAQEREYIAIDALVRLGRGAEARARAGSFLAAYPNSTFAERMRQLAQ